MKKYLFLLSALVLSLPIKMNAQDKEKNQNKSRPNIIYMMSDDHGYQAISAYGYKLNHTPNIDAIANEGMLFNRAFVTNSICGPSRAVMLTGKHSHVNGFMDNHSTFNGNQQTVAKLMHDAGYQTAMVGKWHLISDPQGFDYWITMPGQGEYYNPEFIENGVHKKVAGYVTNLTTDFAINWLEKRDKNKPFFLIYQQKAPHRNWMPEPKYYHLFDSVKIPMPANFYDDYKTRTRAAHEQEMGITKVMNYAYDLKLAFDLPKDKQVGLAGMWQGIYNRMTPEEKKNYEAAYAPANDAFYKANLTGKALDEWKYQRYMKEYLKCVQSVDDNVGRVMDYLKANGLDKNTIIIYTSDQGFYLGEHGWFDKRFMYEESFRTPLIVKWPGVTHKSTTNTMVQNLDFAETILDMAGLPIPSDMQGKSFTSVLKGQKGNIHDALYYHFYENQEHKVAKHVGARTDRYKIIWFYENNEWELYDLKKDQHEMNNVYDKPSYKKVQKMMKEKLQDLMAQYKDQVTTSNTVHK
ncbi:sulfatase family protein [Solitalea koreensis]|uniref:Arylsulfatase A n=1 Tax=Solitalea koreensis TaxID=543615 RepID=A0A521DYT6_9SPHI|nr:sulfatase [Solitalea koreensis]SMO76795.1 Arylsulfatase A [Solitalea koreensis]